MIELLWGANTFEVRQIVRQQSLAMRKKAGEHAIVTCDGQELALADLDTLFLGTSLFAPEQLIIVRDASAHKVLWDALPEYLERAGDNVQAIFTETALDKRTKTYKWFQKHSTVKECAPLRERELVIWIERLVKGWGGAISGATAQALVARVGTDQWTLSQEVRKLLLVQPNIGQDQLEMYVEAVPQATAFDIIEAVFNANQERLTSLWSRIVLYEDPYRFFGLLASQVVALADVAAADGLPPETIAKQAGIHPFVVKKHLAVVRRVNIQHMGQVIDELAATDLRLKTSGGDPWALIRTCLYKIIALVR